MLIIHGFRKVIGKPRANQSQDIPDVLADPRLRNEIDALSVLEVFVDKVSQLNEA